MTTVGFRLYSECSRGKHSADGLKTDFQEVAMNDVDSVGGYAVPVDPMDDLMCDSCQ